MATAGMVKAVNLVKDVEIRWDWVDTLAMVEWRTRYALIDPLLRALGWDTGDPQMCFIEWPVRGVPSPGGGLVRVDYAFFDEGYVESIAAGSVAPVFIVEAKAKHVGLERWVGRLEEYVKGVQEFTEGVAVLTNGRQWWIYEVIWGEPIDRSKREIVDLVDSPAEDVARRLEARLSPDNWFGG